MEIALRSYYSLDGMSLALTTYNFPEDYSSRPDIRVKGIRYLFTHREKYNRNWHGVPAPSAEQLSARAVQMFREMREKRNIECMRELADIMAEFRQDNVLLEQIQDEEEKEEYKQRMEGQRQAINERKANTVYYVANPPPVPKIRTVYTDSQNVHNSKVNQTVIHAFSTLYEMYKNRIVITEIDGKPPTPHQIFDYKRRQLEQIEYILSQKYSGKSDLIRESTEYIRESPAVFGKTQIGLIDGFLAIWYWITEQKETSELEKRLLEEMKEMRGMCTTGHVARLVNVIQGFTDDENLTIKISDKEQIFSVVKQYLTKRLSECEDEKIQEEMISGGENYKRFIRLCVSEKLLEWKKDYGSTGLKEVADAVNRFAGTKVFQD